MLLWESLGSSHFGTKLVLSILDALENLLIFIVIKVLSLKVHLLLIWLAWSLTWLLLVMLVGMTMMFFMVMAMLLVFVFMFFFMLLALFSGTGVLLNKLIN